MIKIYLFALKEVLFNSEQTKALVVRPCIVSHFRYSINIIILLLYKEKEISLTLPKFNYQQFHFLLNSH